MGVPGGSGPHELIATSVTAFTCVPPPRSVAVRCEIGNPPPKQKVDAPKVLWRIDLLWHREEPCQLGVTKQRYLNLAERFDPDQRTSASSFSKAALPLVPTTLLMGCPFLNRIIVGIDMT